MRSHVGELLRKAQLREWALLFFLVTVFSVLSEAEVSGMAHGSCCACLRPFVSFWWKAAPAGVWRGRGSACSSTGSRDAALQLHQPTVKNTPRCSALLPELQGCRGRLAAGSAEVIYGKICSHPKDFQKVQIKIVPWKFLN